MNLITVDGPHMSLYFSPIVFYWIFASLSIMDIGLERGHVRVCVRVSFLVWVLE